MTTKIKVLIIGYLKAVFRSTRGVSRMVENIDMGKTNTLNED